MTAKPWDSVAAAISKLSARLDSTPTVREATLTSPTTVRFDIDDHDTIVRGNLSNRDALVGSRVLTLTLRHYVWVLGVKGGVEPEPYFRCRPEGFSGAGRDWSLTNLVQSYAVYQVSDTEIKFTKPGVYHMHAEALHQSAGTNRVDIEIRKNRSRIQGIITPAASHDSQWRTGGTSTLEVVTPADVESSVYGVTSVIHSSGTATLNGTWSRAVFNRVSIAH